MFKNVGVQTVAYLAQLAAAMTEVRLTKGHHVGPGRHSSVIKKSWKSGKSYEPNGKRECARRVRQMAVINRQMAVIKMKRVDAACNPRKPMVLA